MKTSDADPMIIGRHLYFFSQADEALYFDEDMKKEVPKGCFTFSQYEEYLIQKVNLVTYH